MPLSRVTNPFLSSSGAGNVSITSPAANTIAFTTSGTEDMRIDSAGNIGIGVTPSTWTSTKALEVGSLGTALWSSGAGSASLSAGAYYNSGWKYANATTKPSLIDFDNTGKIGLLTTTATGTAGNAVTFTEMLAVEAGKSLALQGATSQTGAGITFPATQVASSNANTLDDYEEGTWTPSVGGTATYSGNRSGVYIKVGGLVYVSMILQITLLGTGSAGTVTGLPFACNGGPRNTLAFGYWSGVVGNVVFVSSYVGSGSSDIKFLATTSATSGVSDGYGLLSNGAYIMVSGCYYAS